MWVGLILISSAFAQRPVVVASKKFTESVILGDIAAQWAVHRTAEPNSGQKIEVRHQRELGLSQVIWKALLRGDVDVYPEYTGTLLREVLANRQLASVEELKSVLRRDYQVGMTRTLGFDNSFALGMREEKARLLGISKLSDLKGFSNLKFGLSHEFLSRSEGWPSIQKVYQIIGQNPIGIEHELAYRAMSEGKLDVTDLYSTDAEIPYYEIRVLDDDLKSFPSYEAVFIYRLDLERRAPLVIAALNDLEGQISLKQMNDLNKKVKYDRAREEEVANQFLTEKFTGRLSSIAKFSSPKWMDDVLRRGGEHLYLVGVSLLFSILVGIPMGIIAAKVPWMGSPILTGAGVIQTIPSLALLVFMIPIFGIGTVPAIAALFFYSLLPMILNTYTGIKEIPETIRDSAVGLGLSPWQRLRLVEIPMASRSIFAGVKTSAVINVGTATLGSLIGAGGLGQLILMGVRRDDLGMILSGAVPAAVLALVVQWTFDWAESRVLPRAREGAGR